MDFITRTVDRTKQAIEALHERLQRRHDYIETFSTPHGERTLKDILAQAGATRPRFNADPYVSAFNEGQRHMALSIFRQVHGSTDKLPGLMADEVRRMEQNAEQQE